MLLIENSIRAHPQLNYRKNIVCQIKSAQMKSEQHYKLKNGYLEIKIHTILSRNFQTNYF